VANSNKAIHLQTHLQPWTTCTASGAGRAHGGVWCRWPWLQTSLAVEGGNLGGGGHRPQQAGNLRWVDGDLDEQTAASASRWWPERGVNDDLGGQTERRPWRADKWRPQRAASLRGRASRRQPPTVAGLDRRPPRTEDSLTRFLPSMRECRFLARLFPRRQNASQLYLCWSCFYYVQWPGLR
jgi:hypothetical protein